MREFSKEDMDRIIDEELEIFEKKNILVDPYTRALEMRPLMVKDGKYLVSDFTGTQQLTDIRDKTDSMIDKDLFEQNDEVKLLYRSKIWIKPIDPDERRKKGFAPLNFSTMLLDELEAFTRDDKNFDANLWFGELTELFKYNLPFVFQSLGCNFHDKKDGLGCYFCFVDRPNNCPELRDGKGAWIDEQNIVNTFEAIRSNPEWIKENKLEWGAQKGGWNHIRHSGGQPTLHLDLTLKIVNELKKRELPVKLMYDTNLSTGEFISEMIRQGEFPEDILGQLGKQKVSLLTAFKGTDYKSMKYTTQCLLKPEDAFQELEMHVSAGENCYPYLYNGNPYHLNKLIDQGMDRLKNFLPMLHLATIGTYGPTEEHIRMRAKILGKDPEEYLAFQKELVAFNYAKSAELLNARCEKELRVPYRVTSRRTITQEMDGLEVK